MVRLRVLFVALATVVASLSCGGGSSTAPSTGTTGIVGGTGVVMAPPPAGLSAEYWLVGFGMDNLLRRPATGQTVHLDVSALKPDEQDAIQVQAVAATATMAGRQNFDTNPVPGGVNFVVSITNAPIQCTFLVESGACTAPGANIDGTVYGGTIRFVFRSDIMSPQVVAHEVYRTMGITRNGPPGSIMALGSAPAPTPDDIIMFRARYDYPPNSLYAAK